VFLGLFVCNCEALSKYKGETIFFECNFRNPGSCGIFPTELRISQSLKDTVPAKWSLDWKSVLECVARNLPVFLLKSDTLCTTQACSSLDRVLVTLYPFNTDLK
jgi:hypothetical protein